MRGQHHIRDNRGGNWPASNEVDEIRQILEGLYQEQLRDRLRMRDIKLDVIARDDRIAFYADLLSKAIKRETGLK